MDVSEGRSAFETSITTRQFTRHNTSRRYDFFLPVTFILFRVMLSFVTVHFCVLASCSAHHKLGDLHSRLGASNVSAHKAFCLAFWASRFDPLLRRVSAYDWNELK